MKIIYIMGKSSSGKDTIYNILKKKLDVNTYVMYTTRPMRDGEIEGITYNYITDEEMQKYINNKKENKLLEYRVYQTIYGPWFYATIEDEQFKTDKDILMFGTLESYNQIKGYFKEKLLPIYIEVEDGLRLERAIKREKEQKIPRYEEMCRRFLADCKDFSEDNLKKANIKKRFRNINLEECVKEIMEYINENEKTIDKSKRIF